MNRGPINEGALGEVVWSLIFECDFRRQFFIGCGLGDEWRVLARMRAGLVRGGGVDGPDGNL
jgi:hypothetical protein